MASLRQAEVAALKTALDVAGFVGPGGQPCTDPYLFGAMGGIGAAYWVFSYRGLPYPLLSLFTRHAWDSSRRFLAEGLARLGIPHRFAEFSSPKAAERALDEALSAGKPVVVWLSRGALADRPWPDEQASAIPHLVVVQSGTEDGFAVSDRGLPSFRLSRQAIAEARTRVRGEKHRLLLLEPPSAAREPSPIVQEALQSCAQELTTPPAHLPSMVAPNNGLAAIQKWAALLADARDKRGWAKLFPPGLPLYQGLVGIYRWIEIEGGPGALRPLYADFLREAADRADFSQLRTISAQYESLGRQWAQLASSALPRDLPLFARTRSLLDERQSVYARGGERARPRIVEIDDELAALASAAQETFPLPPPEVPALLADLSSQVKALAAAERKAVEALEAAAQALALRRVT